MRRFRTVLFSLLALGFLLSPASGQIPSKLTISVMNLKPGSGISEGEALTLTDRLLVELVRTTRYEVTERARRDEILKEVGFQQTGACDEASCLAQIGKYLRVQKMVGGSVGKIGKTYSVNLRMVDVETGRIEQTAVKDYPGNIDYLLTTAMKDVAWQLARGGLSKREQEELARKQKEEERLAAQRAADSLAAVKRAAAVAESLKVVEEQKRKEEELMAAQRAADSLAAARKADSLAAIERAKAEELKKQEEARLAKKQEEQRKRDAELARIAEQERKEEAARHARVTRRRWSWITFALGGVAGLGAVFESKASDDAYKKYLSATDDASIIANWQKVKDADLRTNIFMGVSTAFVGTSGLLFLTSRGGETKVGSVKGSGMYLGAVCKGHPGIVLVMRF